jgi:hypothetical protein
MFPTEWLTETPAEYQDQFQLLPKTVSLTANQTLTDELRIDAAGCSFYWFAFSVYLYGGAGRPAVRIRDTEGHFMTPNTRLLIDAAPFGNQDNDLQWLPPMRLLPGTRLFFDFREVAGAPVTVAMGIKLWRRRETGGAI